MGSTGSDSFTDYSGKTSIGGKQGGAAQENDCQKAFSTKLEEVDRCTYYTTHHVLPPVHTVVNIELRGRIAAVADTGETIGYLPTKFNYLLACLNLGVRYQGIVSLTGTHPVLWVTIDMAPL